MSWEKVALSDIADFSNGVNFDKSAYSSGVKLIGVSNFGDRFSPDYDELQEIDAKVVRPGDYLIDGDIVFVRSNGNKELVGRCMLIKEPRYSVTYSGFCIRARIKDANKYDPTFFAYYFKSKAFRKALAGNAIGANIQNLSQGRLANHIAYVPNIEVQRKIADVLSAYDDLIESNQKQIKLLEEAAQRLYKEWFVDLRFPGHETTPITDGIPEGWTEGTLVDLAVFKRGKTITKGQVNEGNVPVVAGGLEPAYYHDTPNTDAPVITVSGSGANAGFTRMYYTKVWASDCSYIDVSVTHDIAWIYCFLKENKASIDFMQKGAAQPHVYAKDLNAMKVVVPCDSLMEQFRTAAEPMFSKIGKLEMQIKMLTEARDRLLPKLMNREIEVYCNGA